MKKTTSILLALCMALTLTSCGKDKPPTETPPPEQTQSLTPNVPPAGNGQQGTNNTETPEQPFEGKIAIITNTVDGGDEFYRSAEQIVKKYGEDKIVHAIWPLNFMQEQEGMIEFLAELALDPDIKVLVINLAAVGTNRAVDKLLEKRKDMFIVYCTPAETAIEIYKRANLTLIEDHLLMGSAMVEQAERMGAKTFVHYSFPKHMSMPILSERRELIKQKCDELGIKFVDAEAPNPTSDVGALGAQQFILEDLPRMVEKHGKNTAFFSTDCILNVAVITAVVRAGAIYPQPCCPSPYHGFTTALGIERMEDVDGEQRTRNVDEVIADTKSVVAEKNMTGRLSTWPIPTVYTATYAGTEYAIKWLNGEVPKEGIDTDALVQIMNEYTGVECSVRPFEEDGVVYPNYLLFLEGYITY